MNDKQLNTIMWAVANSTMVADGNTLEHINAGWDELAAMRTPITPDTLEADGWKHERYSAGVYLKTIGEVTVKFDAIAKMFGFGDNSYLWVQVFATSIYDLRLLERLIGGTK